MSFIQRVKHLPSFLYSGSTQEVKSYPVHWIKLVEKLEEGAFHRKHMFQVVIVPSGPLVTEDEMGLVTLYLQAGVSRLLVSFPGLFQLFCYSMRGQERSRVVSSFFLYHYYRKEEVE